MTPLTKTERYLKAVRGEELDRPPVWLMRQAGRYMPEYMALRQNHTFQDHYLEVDVDLSARVIANLVSNAIKFVPEGSTVTVLCATGEDGMAELQVIDQGEGIPEEDQERIFDKFTCMADDAQGLNAAIGLGLTFCKLAVEAHGGRISVQSTVGEGSTFTVTLPLSTNIAGAVDSTG